MSLDKTRKDCTNNRCNNGKDSGDYGKFVCLVLLMAFLIGGFTLLFSALMKG